MTLGLCFWVLLIVWAIFGFRGLSNWKNQAPDFLLLVLLVLLGWQVFGPALHK